MTTFSGDAFIEGTRGFTYENAYHDDDFSHSCPPRLFFDERK